MVSNSPTPPSIVGRLRDYEDIFKTAKALASQSKPFQRILELAYRAGARYFLQWYDNTNPEWKAEYKLCYSRVHPRQPNYLIRLDFFSLNPLGTIKKTNNYFGYVSLRPGPSRTVAECVLKPPVDTKNHYLLCKVKHQIDQKISEMQHIKSDIQYGCPFVQQDAVVGVCAHACIRTISLILAANYRGCESKTVEDIQRKIVTMPLLEGSHIPSTGLMEYEIFSAFEDMGADPMLRTFKEGFESRLHLNLEQMIYPYVESGIPIMVSIETEGERHGIVVVGHTYDQDSWWQQAEIGYFPTLVGGIKWIPSYMWVPDFIVQDDNFGPYMSVPRTLLGLTTSSIVVPIPKSCGAFLAGHEAESLVVNYLSSSELYRYILNRTQIADMWQNLLKKLEQEASLGKMNIVLRPILVTKDTISKYLEELELSQSLGSIYQKISSPEWVWFVEISTPELYSQCKKIGEMIINASYPEVHIQTGLEPLLALRMFDVVVLEAKFDNHQIIDVRKPIQILQRGAFELT